MIEDLKEIIAGGFKKHRDYDAVVEYANLSYNFVTGEGQKKHLKKLFEKVEEPNGNLAYFRGKVYESLTPEQCNKVSNHYNRIKRIEPITHEIDIKSPEASNANSNRIAAALTYFTDFCSTDRDLYSWINNNYDQDHRIDPNMWYVLKGQSEEKQVSFEITKVPAKNAINWKYDCGVLQYLLISTLTGHNLITTDKDIVIEPTKEDKLATPLEDFEISDGDHTIVVGDTSKQYFKLTIVPNKGIIATRIGFIRDDKTEGRTYVNQWDSVKSRFFNLMYHTSEFLCNWHNYMKPDVKEFGEPLDQIDMCQCDQYCGECHRQAYFEEGTSGPRTKRSSQQTEVFRINIEDLAAMAGGQLDLNKMRADFMPPIELIDEQRKQIDIEIQAILESLTGSSDITNSGTYGEEYLKNQNRHDILFDMAEHIINLNRFFVLKMFGYLKAVQALPDDSVIQYQLILPKDLNPKSNLDRLNELNAAKEVGDKTTMAALQKSYRNGLYENNPLELEKIETWLKLDPLTGLTESEKVARLSLDMTSDETNMYLSDAEISLTQRLVQVRCIVEDNYPDFYTQSYSDQRDIALTEALKLSPENVRTVG